MGNLLPNPGNGRSASGSSDGVFVASNNVTMRQLEAVIGEVAQSEAPVLLLGERGVGKRHTARRIHDLSRRNGQPVCELTCCHLSAETLAGAHRENEAFGGTLFLNEAAELSRSCQSYLCDTLLKGTEKGLANGHRARFICGSAVDLEMEVKARRLREDLYYRISGVCLRLPPLRQRREDIPALMDYFLQKYAREFGRPVPELSAETLRLFHEYSWPGNVRELEDAARVLVALGDERLAMGGLRALLQPSKPAETEGATVSLKAVSRAASHEAERELILSALTRTRWNRRRAAQELQISYKALLYKLKEIGFKAHGAR